jgi:membrane protease subunit (stomatin/prohibitin family)
MGLVDFVKKQFIDILAWTEPDDETLAWRFPTADLEIQQGAQLVVRDTQAALFVHEGQAADLFGPGRHTIRTGNLPVLTDLRHWTKRFESPIKSEVYFFSLRHRLDQRWGTPAPITIRDAEFGAVRVRAFGIYSYRIAEPRTFFAKVSGTRDAYTVAELDGQLRATVVATLAAHFGASAVPFLDMAASQEALAAAVREKAAPSFAALGLALEDLRIESISVPPELQERLDERIGMGMVGDLGTYTRFQAARSIPLAAAGGDAGGGSIAGAGVGMGVGMAMGQTMAQALGQPAAKPAAGACATCGAPLERASRFCPDCGAAQS